MQTRPMHPFGILHFVHYTMGCGESPILATTSISITFILEGTGSYNGICFRAGDVVALGMNKHPLVGTSNDATALIVSMEVELFHRLTGMFPLVCAEVTPLTDVPFFRRLCEMLIQAPPCHRAGMAELRLLRYAEQSPYVHRYKMDRICHASKMLESRPELSLESVVQELSISKRQLERDFVQTLGMTPREYSRIVRFRRSMKYLKQMNPVQAALMSGYCDQAHMAKEYKALSIWTPTQCRKQLDKSVSELPVVLYMLPD
ncbi:helix-turn-helix domain-containing protein [Gorillibacterium sp. sgz5001074]|uniref:helix-turn-helix domain-containing protein n=1 Tax=Gorillibacterium sp. sgz5001074 TaxID=3446695 RepID=UPI003F676C25